MANRIPKWKALISERNACKRQNAYSTTNTVESLRFRTAVNTNGNFDDA